MPDGPTMRARMFFRSAAKEKFDKNINKRVLWLEKGFLFKDESLEYGEEIMSIF